MLKRTASNIDYRTLIAKYQAHEAHRCHMLIPALCQI